MRVKAELKGTTLSVKVTGEFDMIIADEFKRTVDSYLDSGLARYLLVDLSQVTFIDSSGLGAILGRYKKVQHLKGKMVIAGPQIQVKKILEVSGINRVIGIFKDRDSAMSQLL